MDNHHLLVEIVDCKFEELLTQYLTKYLCIIVPDWKYVYRMLEDITQNLNLNHVSRDVFQILIWYNLTRLCTNFCASFSTPYYTSNLDLTSFEVFLKYFAICRQFLVLFAVCTIYMGFSSLTRATILINSMKLKISHFPYIILYKQLCEDSSLVVINF